MIIANNVRHEVREEVFFLIALRRADINRTGSPIVLATIAVSFLEVFQIFAHPGLIAVAEVDECRVAFAQVLVVIVHERRCGVTVEPGNHFDILFEEIFFDWSHQTSIAVFTDEVNLFQF